MNLSAVIAQKDLVSDENEPHLLSTFRDPAGQLHLAGRYAMRRVYPHAQSEARDFLESHLREDLENRGRLIPTAIVDRALQGDLAFGEMWLQHPRIDPISYPWEWTPLQWRAAGELTLQVATQAIEAGWTLKDATPLNILFDGARPVFVDVLSFERRDPRSGVWLAFGQFVRTFLLPLLAAKYLRWPLEATQFWRDGIEPGTLYRALPLWRRFDPRLLDVVTLPAILEGPVREATARALRPVANADLATYVLSRRIGRLARKIELVASEAEPSQWSEYTQWANHYSADDIKAKGLFVHALLEELRPARVLDIGANTGTYSLLAAQVGARVTALESDSAAASILWRTAADRKLPITVLTANIARPTPASGWLNGEQLSLLDRLSGGGRS